MLLVTTPVTVIAAREGKTSLGLALNFKAADLGEANPVLHNKDMWGQVGKDL